MVKTLNWCATSAAAMAAASAPVARGSWWRKRQAVIKAKAQSAAKAAMAGKPSDVRASRNTLCGDSW